MMAARSLDRMLIPALAVAIILSLAGQFGRSSSAAEDSVDQTKSPVVEQFRTIEAPLETIIREFSNQNLTPMKRDEFNEIVRALRMVKPRVIERGVFLEQAVYTARLEGRNLVDGSAKLTIRSTSKGTTKLPMPTFGLAIRNPIWKETGRPANIGLSSEGELVLLVPESGELQFDWTLTAESSSSQTNVFVCELAEASINRLLVRTEMDVMLKADRGVISYTDSSFQRTWAIDLGWNRKCVVQTEESNDAKPTHRGFLSQSTSYRLMDRGADVSSTIELDRFTDWQSPLLLTFSDGLAPTEIRINEQPVKWSTVAGERDATRIIAVDVAEIIGAARLQNGFAASTNRPRRLTARVSAYAPIIYEKRWQLPVIEMQHAEWLQQRSYLTVIRPLVLKDIRLQDCRLHRVSSDVMLPNAERTYEIRSERPTGQVAVFIGRETARYEVTSGTNVVINETTAHAKFRAQVQSLRGSVFRIVPMLQPAWEIEDIELIDDDGKSIEGVEDWEFNQDPSATSQPVVLDLRKPIDREKPITIVATAKRSIKLDSDIRVDEMIPIKFASDVTRRSLFAIKTPDAMILRWGSDQQSNWRARGLLSEIEAETIEIGESQPVLLIDENSADVSFQLSQEKSIYNCEIESMVSIQRNHFGQEIRIRIKPQSSSIRSIPVRIFPGIENLEWKIDRGDDLVTLPVNIHASSDNGEDWIIELDQAITEPCVITGTWNSTFDQTRQASLPHVLDADSQSKRLSVFATIDAPVRISAGPAYQELRATDFDATSKYVYRSHYAYLDRPGVADANRFAISPAAVQEQGRVAIWMVETTSLVDKQGNSRHIARLMVENQGATSLELSSDSVIKRIEVDGEAIEPSTDLSMRLQIQIPPERRYVDVRVFFAISQAMPSWIGSQVRRPSFEIIGVPALQEVWKVWLPPETTFGARVDIDKWREPQSLGYRFVPRFFGPFVRESQTSPFNFFSEQSWLTIVGAADHDDQTRSIDRLVDALMANVATTEQTSSRDEASSEFAPLMNWGDVFERLDRANRNARTRTLITPLIDAKRLALRGIQADTPFVRAEGHSEESVDPLQAYDLVVIAAGRRLVLTTAEAAGLFSDELQWTKHPRIAVARLRQSSAVRPDVIFRERLGSLLEVDSWIKNPVSKKWNNLTSDDYALVLGGWKLHQFESDRSRRQVSFYDLPIIWRLSGIAFLVATATSWRLARKNVSFAIAFMATAAVACLVVPDFLVTLCSLVFWGAIVGTIFNWMTPCRTLESQKRQVSITTDTTLSIVPVIAFLLLMVFSDPAQAQSEREYVSKPPSADRVFNVFVPIDENKKPDSNYLHLPREFFDSLNKRYAAITGSATKWIVLSAKYQASFESSTNQNENEIDSVSAIYRLRVLADDAEILFPLSNEVIQNIGSVQLNQRSIRVVVSDDKKAIRLPIWETGEYDLELIINTKTQAIANKAQIELAIPRVLDSTLRITSFSDFREIEVDGAVGQTIRDVQQGQLAVSLGPIETLSFRWSNDDTFAPMAANAEKMLWLNVERDEVTVDLRLKINAPMGQIDQVGIVIDGHLNRQANYGATPESVQSLNNGQTKRLFFTPTLDDFNQANIDIRFSCSDVFGVGKIRIPQIKVEGIDVSTNLLAITVANGSEAYPDTAPGVTRLSRDGFLASWGPTQRIPAFAYSAIEPEFDFSFPVIPTASRSEANCDAYYLIGKNKIELAFLAEVSAVTQPMLIVRFDIDPRLTVQNVLAVQNDVNRSVVWSRSSERTVTVFLDTPIDGPTRLILNASSSMEGEDVSLPAVNLNGANTLERRVFLYRYPHTSITDIRADGFQQLADDQTQPQMLYTPSGWSSARHLHSVWEGSASLGSDAELEASAIRFKRGKNQGRYAADVFIVIAREEESRSYHVEQIECQLRVLEGQLDSFRLRLPTSLGQLTQTGIMGEIYPSSSSSANDQFLTFQPNEPIDSDTTFWLYDAQLANQDDVQSVLSRIRFEAASEMTQTICLPIIANDDLKWEVTGLNKVDATWEVAPEGLTEDSHHFYEFASDRYSIRLVPTSSADEPPQVKDVVHRAWLSGSEARILSGFSVVAQQSGEYRLRTKAGAVIDQVLLNHAPLDFQVGKTIPLDLAETDVPQELRVIWHTTTDKTASNLQVELTAPQIVFRGKKSNDSPTGIAVGNTSWELGGLESQVFGPLSLTLNHDADSIGAAGVAKQRSYEQTAGEYMDSKPIHRYEFSGDASRIVIALPTLGGGIRYDQFAAAILVIGASVFLHQQAKQVTRGELAMWAYAAGVLFGLTWWLFLQPSLFGWVIIGLTVFIAWLTRW